MIVALKVMAACGLDAAIGDPRWFPHPVRLMGLLAHGYEKGLLRWTQGKASRYVAGAVLALGLPLLCYASAEWILHVTSEFNEGVRDVVWILLGYTTIAAKDLADHAKRVYHALEDQSLDIARIAVSSIVGRDTVNLSEPDVIRATVETVAESTSDGVIAPLCYLAIGGPSLALAYKAVNTLDSMIGHRTERYQYFGWASAKCDDVLNWVPARLSGVCLVLAAWLLHGTGKHAWHILLRDGGKHASPNSGRPEAAMAGALQVQLGGSSTYNGIQVTRPLIGDPMQPFMLVHISHAIQLMTVAYLLAIIVIIGILWI
ncbi:MAG: cobalamin biosynthesis protein CobD [Nitrospirales bacterium]|nr:MAG: cobalamin biosynthesis protein CobD [Nitrospirales bacterium]